MIRHIVVYKIKEDAGGHTKQENMEAMRDGLLALVPQIPEIKHMEVGFDVLHDAASYDISLLVDFDDVAAMDRYKNHSDHQKIAQFIHSIIEGRVSVDYEI